MAGKQVNLKDSLRELNSIVEWFEAQEEIDVEAGLEKVKAGAALVKVCKTRLSEIENEFEQIQRDVETESPKAAVSPAGAIEYPAEEINPDDIPF